MSYIDNNLMPGEQIVHRAKRHPVIFVWTGMWFILGALLFAGKATDGGVVCILIGAILGVAAFFDMSGSEFGVTNKRVIIKVGVLRRKSLEILLNKVEGVSVDQGILGRVLGYGNIIVNGTGSTKEPFKSIADPLEFRRRVQEQIEVSANRPAASA